MASFAYQAQLQNGQVEKGVLEAATKSEALAQLASQRKQVYKLEERGLVQKSKGLSFSSKPDLQKFFEDLSELVGSGLKIDIALKVISENQNSTANQNLYDQILSEITVGKSFSKALVAQEIFTPDVVALVSAGEESGQLGEVLPIISEDIRQNRERGRELFEALSYPCFLMVVMILAIVAIANFLVPSIEPLFAGSDNEVPFVLTIFIALRETGGDVLVGFLVILSILALVFILPSTRTLFNQQWSSFVLRIPILGYALKLVNTSRFLRSLSVMLGNGVHLHDAADLAAKSVKNVHIQNKLMPIPDAIAEGRDFPSILSDTGVFETEVLSIIAIGDQINKLDVVTRRAANLLDARSNRAIIRLTGLVSPFVTILMGLMIGALAYSVMTALLSINNLAV